MDPALDPQESLLSKGKDMSIVSIIAIARQTTQTAIAVVARLGLCTPSLEVDNATRLALLVDDRRRPASMGVAIAILTLAIGRARLLF